MAKKAVKLDEVVYYRFKSRIQDTLLTDAKAAEVLRLGQEKREQAMREAGLDPRHEYRLEDGSFTATVVK